MGILGSILGIVVLLVIAVLFSNNRKAINLRTVLGALAIQIGFAALILYVPFDVQCKPHLGISIRKIEYFPCISTDTLTSITGMHTFARLTILLRSRSDTSHPTTLPF